MRDRVFAFEPSPQTEPDTEVDHEPADWSAPELSAVPRTLVQASGGRARRSAPGKAMVTDRLAQVRDQHRRKALARIYATWPDDQPSVLHVQATGERCDVQVRRRGDRGEIVLEGPGAATLATAPRWAKVAPHARIEVTAGTRATIGVALAELPLDVLVQLERLELSRAFGLGDHDPVLATARELIDRLGLGAVEIYRGELGRARARAAGARGVMHDGAVYLDEATFEPSSTDARRLIAHELAHVVQATRSAHGADAGARAEAEAHRFADAFALHTALPPLREGLPADHLAAEGPPPAGTMPAVPGLATPTVAPIDVEVDPLRALVDDDLSAAFGAVCAEPAYQDLVGATCDAAAPTDAATQGDDAAAPGGCPDQPAPADDAGPGAPDDGAAPTADAALDELTAAPSFEALADAAARVCTPTGEPMQASLVEAFDAYASPDTCAPDEVDAMTAVLDAATEAGTCSDATGPRDEAQTEFDKLPADPAALYDFESFLNGQSVPPDLGAPPPAASPAPRAPSQPAAPLAPTLSQDLPLATSLVAARGTSPDDAATYDAAVAVSADAAMFGEAGSIDRAKLVLNTVLSSSLGPFAAEFVRQGLDTLVLDTMGTIGDLALRSLLERVGQATASKVPVAGPMLMLGYEMWSSGGPIGFLREEANGVLEGVSKLAEIGTDLLAAMNARTTSERLDAVFQTQADFHGAVAQFCEVAATACGLLAAASFVAGFAVGFTGAGAALTPEALVVGKLLADACTALGLIAIAERGVAALFEVLAGMAAPVELYREQNQDIADAVALASSAAGGFVGDKAAGTLRTEALRAISERPRREAEIGREPETRTREGQARAAQAEAARAAVQAEVERRAATLEEQVRAADEERPPGDLDDQPAKQAPPAAEVDPAEVLGRVLMVFPDALRQSLADLGSSVTRLQSAVAQNASIETVSRSIDDLTTSQRALKGSIADLRSQAAEAAAEFRTAQAADALTETTSPEVAELRERHRELLDELTATRNLLDDVEGKLRTTATQLAELQAEKQREQAAIGEDTAVGDGQLDQPSSGNATGGIGSAYKDLIDAVFDAITGLAEPRCDLSAADVLVGQFDEWLSIMDLESPSDGTCPAQDEDDAVSRFWAAHGEAIASDLMWLSDGLPRLLGAATQDPPVSTDQVADDLDTSLGAHDDFVAAQVSACFLDESAVALGAIDVTAASGGLDAADAVIEAHLADIAHTTTLTEAARDHLGECRAAAPAQQSTSLTGPMADVTELLDQTGMLTTLGPPPILDQDPFVTTAAATAQLDGADQTLAQQSEDLAALSSDAQGQAQGLADVRTELDAACGPIATERAQVAAAAKSRAAEATAAAARSEEAAARATSGLGSLEVFSAEQGAALDELSGTCSE